MRTVTRVACAIVVLAGACKKSTNEKAAAGGRGGGAASVGDDPGEALSKKVNPYVVCLNGWSRDVFSGRHSWFDSFGENGPDAKDLKHGTVYGPRKLDDPKKCAEGIAQAKGMKPPMPELEAAGDAYAAALAELAPIYARSDEYFDQKDYKDDELAWAIAQHPALVAGWAKFDGANDKLEEEVDELEDRIATDHLAWLEKSDGKHIGYHHQNMLIAAKKLVRRAGMIESPEELELEAFQKDLAAYETAYQGVHDYYEANKKEVDDQVHTYWTVEGPAKDLLQASKNLMRRKRDHVKFSQGEKMTIEANNAEAVEGHPATVVKAYNALIDSSNRLF